MLSDSLSEAIDTIWEAVQNYDYSEAYKEEIVNGLVELSYVVYKLDRLQKDWAWSKEDIKQHVMTLWDEKK